MASTGLVRQHRLGRSVRRDPKLLLQCIRLVERHFTIRCEPILPMPIDTIERTFRAGSSRGDSADTADTIVLLHETR